MFAQCCTPNCNERERFQDLVQAVLDSPDLEEHLVYKKGNSKQLVVLNKNLLYDDINLSKFGNPVLLLSVNKIDSLPIKAYVEFHDIRIYKDSAEVTFTYKIHGILGRQRYKLGNCKWKLTYSRVGFAD